MRRDSKMRKSECRRQSVGCGMSSLIEQQVGRLVNNEEDKDNEEGLLSLIVNSEGETVRKNPWSIARIEILWLLIIIELESR